jgi:hypothetical protein
LGMGGIGEGKKWIIISGTLKKNPDIQRVSSWERRTGSVCVYVCVYT